jgi:chemotaxis response regulator CheB
MDINMPIKNGLEATEEIMRDNPLPIVIFSTEADAEVGFKAVSLGAVEVIKKPEMTRFNDPEFFGTFIEKLKKIAASGSAVPTVPHREREVPARKGEYSILVMGASTGGPLAVKEILSNLPASFPLGIALVQHLEEGFDEGYAQWLNDASPLSVRLAREKDYPQAGEVIIAPVNIHLACRDRKLRLEDSPKVLNQKPSVDVLFSTASKEFGSRALAVLLTGMGRDGAAGCLEIVNAGGTTIVQDEATSTIFGMPKAAIEAGGASTVLPLGEIAGFLIDITE